MNKIQIRNAQIIRMRNKGVASKRIMEKFDLSRSRIQQIVKKHELVMARRQKSYKLRKEMGVQNDLSRKYKSDEILDSLLLTPRMDLMLINHFLYCRIKELSLFDVINILITDEDLGSMTYAKAMPVLAYRNIGPKTYFMTVNLITKQCSFCESFKKEWLARKNKLKKYFKLNGYDHLYKKIL